MARQFGYFFLYIGLIITIIAVSSFKIQAPAYGVLFLGIGITCLGFMLIWRYRLPPADSQRFKYWKKITAKRK
jgi:hypothetical protein